MNKGDLIESVAAQLGESKAVATRAVDAVLKGVRDGVREDERVSIAGFGTFKKKKRKERSGINPSTKERIVIPASTTLGFTPSQTLRDKL